MRNTIKLFSFKDFLGRLFAYPKMTAAGHIVHNAVEPTLNKVFVLSWHRGYCMHIQQELPLQNILTKYIDYSLEYSKRFQMFQNLFGRL